MGVSCWMNGFVGKCTTRVEFADYGVVALVMRNDDKVCDCLPIEKTGVRRGEMGLMVWAFFLWSRPIFQNKPWSSWIAEKKGECSVHYSVAYRFLIKEYEMVIKVIGSRYFCLDC